MFPFGQTLYLWRLERGLTQSELARRTGIARPNLSRIEQGGQDVTIQTLRRLAEALDIRPGLLADGLPPEPTRRRRLTRKGLDRIARAAVGRKLALSGEEKELAGLVRSVLKRKLGLTSRYGRSLPRTAKEEEKNWLRLKVQIGAPAWANLLHRVQKLQGT